VHTATTPKLIKIETTNPKEAVECSLRNTLTYMEMVVAIRISPAAIDQNLVLM
jgi:hypothetical protein